MSRAMALSIVAAVVVIACIRIAMTHAVFSPTWDEPAHVTAGWDYLVQHKICDPNAYRSLTDPFPFRRIGKSIRLYYVP